MAEEHNAIHYGADLLKSFGLQLGLGGGEGVTRLSETLTPVVDVWSRPEAAYLRGERLCWGHVEPAAVAAQISYCQLVNPVGSGTIIVVDRILVASAAATDGLYLRWGSSRSTGAAANEQFFRDTRLGTTRKPTGIIIGGANRAGDVATPGTIATRVCTGGGENTNQIVDPGVVLGPGTQLLIEEITVNVALRVSIHWRERLAYPGELA